MNTSEVHVTSGVNCAAADFSQMSLSALANHIEATHHAYLREELPRLIGLSGHVAAEHGRFGARLSQICQIVVALAAELASHMRKEELVLFPMIRELEKGQLPPALRCGTLCNPVRQMVLEHDDASTALSRLRDLTDDFHCPDHSNAEYRALVDGLANLERDLQLHIEKENAILFRRALALEEAQRLDALVCAD